MSHLERFGSRQQLFRSEPQSPVGATDSDLMCTMFSVGSLDVALLETSVVLAKDDLLYVLCHVPPQFKIGICRRILEMKEEQSRSIAFPLSGNFFAPL